MEVSPATLNRFNLTSRIVVTNFTPVFTGNYSNVYQGTFEGNTVAVKVIRAIGDPHSMHRKILREMIIWASLDHKNIHPFYGFANDQAFAPFGGLISPWCAHGDANKFLKEHGTGMSESERIKLWSGIADGVAHLHQNNPVIVHGDLKPGNVLIDASGRPRICDFGLSQVFFDETDTGFTTTSEHAGTERYLAPELVASEINVSPTTLSDVYAVGCLGLEIVYLQKPHSQRKNNLRGQIIRDLRNGTPPAADPPRPWSKVWLIIQSCWNKKPELRPSATIVAQLLKPLSEAAPAATVLMSDYHDESSRTCAEKLHRETLEKQTKSLGAEHLDTISAAASLAIAYYDQGRWNDAERLQLNVWEKRERIQGEDHLDTIDAAARLARTYYKQGRWNNAEKLELMVLQKRQRIQGAEDLDTVNAAANLARTYCKQGRWNDAEKLELEVLEKRKKIQGPEHLDAIKAASRLASTYYNQERWNDAEKLEVEVLEMRMKTQGREHLDTISAAASLATTYYDQGRWNDAEKLELNVLEKRKRVQGAEHLDTIKTAANLAVAYFKQGRWNDAEKLEVEVLERLMKILGAEHSDTIKAATNLARTYHKQGRWNDALELEVHYNPK